MADVHNSGPMRRAPSQIEYVMRTMESTCRMYDRRITRCVWLIVALISWFIVADSIIRTDNLYFDGTPAKGKSLPVQTTGRADVRVMYRAFRVMEAQCDGNAVLIGPQVRVNGEPYMFRVMRVCDTATDVVNPVIAVSERTTGTCIDEVDGIITHRPRRYPITVHSDNNPPMTLMELTSVCTFMQALDMLDGIW